MKQKLIKQFENGTDFSVCVIAMENGTYVVTEYDFVNKKHELKGKYNDKNQALIAAKEINKSFMEPSKQTIKLKESQLRKMIKETLNELDWKTYANAARKAHEWRNEHPFLYDRNRGLDFDNAAQKSFNQQHGIENLPDYGGEKGNINFASFHGEPEISGSRNHDFGDGEGPFNLSHTVYHMGKKYGKDGGYGRTRMWDHPHETTPEEFFDSDEMGKKFRDAEQEVDNYRNGKYRYDNEKGWHLNESQLQNIIKESIKKVLK